MPGRSQAVALKIVPPVVTSSDLIAQTAQKLTELKTGMDATKDQRSWDLATEYVTAYPLIAEALRDEGLKSTPQKINKAIRMEKGYAGPGTSWLSHAKRTFDFVEEVFGVNPKKLPYEHYRRIAVCRLQPPQKQKLRVWAEDEQVTQEELRARIRQEVDKLPNTGFTLKCDNCWRFSEPIQSDFDGGIHPLTVANLLYYCTDPGDVIVDPMAGGDTTYKVVKQYPYFQRALPDVDGSGKRTVHRADIAPHVKGIVQADATKQLPWSDGFADFCLFDPPYYKVAEGKYGMLGSTIEEWQEAMSAVAQEVWRVLKPGGKVAIITEDYLRVDDFQPLGRIAANIFTAQGFSDWMVFYDIHKGYLSISPMQQACYKRNKTILNGVKVISVFTKAVEMA